MINYPEPPLPPFISNNLFSKKQIHPAHGGTEINSEWNHNIQAASLDSVQFPCELVGLSFKHRIVEHRKPNVPGANIEDTGRDPIIFTLKAPFFNGLLTGIDETWGGQSLFPATFARVFQMLLTTDVRQFVHPTLGQYSVVPVRVSSELMPNIRNGQVLNFELITANQNDKSANIFSELANTPVDLQVAAALDNGLAKIFTKNPADNFTFLNAFTTMQRLLNAPAQIVGSISTIISSPIGLANSIINRAIQADDACTALENQIKSYNTGIIQPDSDNSRNPVNSNFTSTNNSTNTVRQYPVVSNLAPDPSVVALTRIQIQVVISNANTVLQQQQQQSNNITILKYTVKQDTTLGYLSNLLRNSIEQLLTYNSYISTGLIIPKGTLIYYIQTPSSQQQPQF